MNDKGTKKCTTCKKERPLACFHKDPRNFSGCMSSCKECRNHKSRVYHERNNGGVKNHIELLHKFGFMDFKHPIPYDVFTDCPPRIIESFQRLKGEWMEHLGLMIDEACHRDGVSPNPMAKIKR